VKPFLIGTPRNNSLCRRIPKYNRGFPAAAPCSHDVAVKLDKLRQLKYRQRAKISLSILTLPRSLTLLAYRPEAM
jgi:hypothetical protein